MSRLEAPMRLERNLRYNIYCLQVWMLEYIHEEKIWGYTISQTERWVKYIGQCIYHQVNVFQPPHKLKTLNIWCISLLRPFLQFMDFSLTFISHFCSEICSSLIGLPILKSVSPRPCVCTQMTMQSCSHLHFVWTCARKLYQWMMGTVKMINANQPMNCLEFMYEWYLTN